MSFFILLACVGVCFDCKVIQRKNINLLQAVLRAAEQKRDGRNRETDALSSEFQVHYSGNYW